jgi:hypothetical protein
MDVKLNGNKRTTPFVDNMKHGTETEWEFEDTEEPSTYEFDMVAL